MQHNSVTAIFKTVSGLVGGVGKAVTARLLLLAITLHGLTSVVLYTAACSTAGYVVKYVLGNLSVKLNNYFKENCKADNEKVVVIAFVYGIFKLLNRQNVSAISTLKIVNLCIHTINLG